jgi:hypothetical protein
MDILVPEESGEIKTKLIMPEVMPNGKDVNRLQGRG